MYNFTYEDLNKLKEENKLYIHKDKMNWDFHQNKDIKILFTNIAPQKEPYLEMKITEKDIFKVNLILNYEERKEKREFTVNFIKVGTKDDKEKRFSIIEILIGLSIMAIVSLYIIKVTVRYTSNYKIKKEETLETVYMEEAFNSIKYILDKEAASTVIGML